MLNGGYWAGLKDYYETDYNGIAAGKHAIEFAEEMIAGKASFLSLDRDFDPTEIGDWVSDMEDQANTEANGGFNGEFIDISETPTLQKFPRLSNYYGYFDEIASYFMWKNLDTFREKIAAGDQDFIDEAIRLNWTEMIEEIPLVKDVFLF